MRRTSLAILFAAAIVLFAGPAPRASAVPPDDDFFGEVLAVSSGADSGPGSLRHQVELANSLRGKVWITIPAGIGQITLNSQLRLQRKVTISGPGSSALKISGGDSTRIFEVDKDVTADISGVSLVHGRDTGSPAYGPKNPAGDGLGGAILNRGTANLEDVVFADNAAVGGRSQFAAGGSGYGGAILNLWAMTIKGGAFVDNSALGNGDHDQFASPDPVGGGAAGGAIRNEGSLILERTELRGNKAVGADGITVQFAWGYDGSDAGPGLGGAIYNGPWAEKLEVVASTLAGNLAKGGIAGRTIQKESRRNGVAWGGAIYSAGAGLRLERSTVFGNALESQMFERRPGAGLYLERKPAMLRSDTIAFNSGESDIDTAVRGPVVNTIIGSCSGAGLASGGFNIDYGSRCGLTGTTDKQNTDARLGPLSNQGGPTRTLPIYRDSPALDQGRAGEGEGVDQRGSRRPVAFSSIPRPPDGDGTDIGAFELQRLSTVDLAPAELNFGDVRVGMISKPLELTVTNVGSDPLRIGEVTLGANEEDYSISSQSCKSTTLAVGADCRVRIRFAPTDDGPRPGALRLATSPGGDTLVAIKGRGVE